MAPWLFEFASATDGLQSSKRKIGLATLRTSCTWIYLRKPYTYCSRENLFRCKQRQRDRWDVMLLVWQSLDPIFFVAQYSTEVVLITDDRVCSSLLPFPWSTLSRKVWFLHTVRHNAYPPYKCSIAEQTPRLHLYHALVASQLRLG